jgi:DNA-binding Lrp family transcriptional regulator
LEAYILINTEAGKVWKAAEDILKIKGMKKAHAVTGQFDVIAYAKFPRIGDLTGIIDAIQAVQGVVRTRTAVAMAKRPSSL